MSRLTLPPNSNIKIAETVCDTTHKIDAWKWPLEDECEATYYTAK